MRDGPRAGRVKREVAHRVGDRSRKWGATRLGLDVGPSEKFDGLRAMNGLRRVVGFEGAREVKAARG